MIKIDRFNENLSDDDFHIGKKDLIKKFEELIEVYEDFINDLSPTFWRVSGHQLTELKHFMGEVNHFSPITDSEMEIPWVKEQRFKK